MNNKILNKTIEITKALAPTNKELRCSHVAFLVKKNKILHIGTNKLRTHPLTQKFSYHLNTLRRYIPTGLHAEMDVILKSGIEDLSGFELVVTRMNRNGNFANSRSCSGCMELIRYHGIKNVYFSNLKGEIEKL